MSMTEKFLQMMRSTLKSYTSEVLKRLTLNESQKHTNNLSLIKGQKTIELTANDKTNNKNEPLIANLRKQPLSKSEY